MNWLDIWSYNQQDYRSWPSKIWRDHQQIKIVMNHHTDQLRLRFSNRFGMEALCFENVTISTQEMLEPVPVTIAGKELIAILPETELVSDPISCRITPGMTLQIDTQLSKPVALTGGIVTYSQSITTVNNFLNNQLQAQNKQFRMVAENPKMQYIYGISGIDVPQRVENHTGVIFGDSLVQQGFIVDQLKWRLLKNKMTDVAIINRGIGGNRVLSGTDRNFDFYDRHGLPGTLRYETDIFSKGSVDSVIVVHGINDILTAYNDSGKNAFSIEGLINGWKQYAELAKMHNATCYIGTLMPFKKSIFYKPRLEEYRQEANCWIRDSHIFDGYFDFDKAVADTWDSFKLKDIYDSGDGLHLNEAGGGRVAKTVNLDIFR